MTTSPSTCEIFSIIPLWEQSYRAEPVAGGQEGRGFSQKLEGQKERNPHQGHHVGRFGGARDARVGIDHRWLQRPLPF